MLSGFWAAVENVMFLLFFFLCLILAVYACGLSLSFLPCVFVGVFFSHSALFARSRFVFLFFCFCRRGSAGFLTQQLSFTSFPLHLIVTGSFCTLLSCFCFCIFFLIFRNICRTVCTYPSPGHHSRGTDERGGGRLDSGALLWQRAAGRRQMRHTWSEAWWKKRMCGNSKMETPFQKIGNF